MAATHTYDELIPGIKGQTRAAFDSLYVTYTPLLCFTIRKVLTSEALLEETLEATIAHIWTGIDQYNPQHERIYTWMIRIAKHEALLAERRTAAISFENTDKLPPVAFPVLC